MKGRSTRRRIRATSSLLLVGLACLLAALAAGAHAADVWDSFDREGPSLGTTEDPNHYPWMASGSAPVIEDNQLYIAFTGGNQGAGISGFTPADFDMTVRVKMQPGGWVGIPFRQPSGDASFMGDGYMPHFYPGADNFLLYYWGLNHGVLKQVVVEDVDWSVYHTIRIAVIGDHHRLWFDDVPLVNVRNAGKTTGGHIGLWRQDGVVYFDDLEIIANPPPAEDGDLQGRVMDANTLAAIQGAEVRLDGRSTVTNELGFYEFLEIPEGGYDIIVLHDDYEPAHRATNVVAGSVTTEDFLLTPYDVTSPIAEITDTFSRPDSTILGTTEDAGRYPWLEYPGEMVSIAAEEMNLAAGGGGSGASLGGIYPTNFDVSLDLRLTTAHWAGMAYRGHQLGVHDMTGCYLVYVTPISTLNGRVDLWTPNAVLTSYVTGIDFAATHNLRVRAIGDRHTVWIDGNKIIDYLDTRPLARDTGGYFSIVRHSTNMTCDNLNLKVYSAFTPGCIVGRVIESGTGKPFAGVTVYFSNGSSAITAADGSFRSGDFFSAGQFKVAAVVDGYYAPEAVVNVAAGETANVDLVMTPIASPQTVITDTFTREDNADLGVTEDAGHYPWMKGFTEPGVTIASEALALVAGGAGTGATIAGFCPVDLDISFDVSIASNVWAGVQYRGSAIGAQGAGSYLVYVTPLSLGVNGRVDLHRGSILMSNETGLDFSVPQRLRVKAEGPRHQVWANDQLIIDVIDDLGYVGPGTVSLLRHSGPSVFDNLSVTRLPVSVVESASAAKSLVDGSVVSMGGQIVTGQFEGFIYVETPDRSSGIKVKDEWLYNNNILFNVGDKVTVYGTVGTENGEKFIEATAISTVGTGTISPVGLNGRTIAGDEGLSVIGLLATAWGKVLSVDWSDYSFVISDGSELSLKVMAPLTGTLPMEDEFVSCTGVLGKDDTGGIVLRMRVLDDMVSQQP